MGPNLDPLMEHTRLKPASGVNHAVHAAQAVADDGGSPRQQIDAARAVSGQRLGYLPHQGSRQKARTLARMQAAHEKAAPIATHPFQLLHSMGCGNPAFFLTTMPGAGDPISSADCLFPNGERPQRETAITCGSCGEVMPIIDVCRANITHRQPS
jgi:hypothetical protein